MTLLSRRTFVAGLATMPLAQSAQAGMRPYVLVPSGTSVKFTFVLSGVVQSGTMPIRSADIRIDIPNLANSRVDVLMDVSKARTKLPFARGPMLGQNVLDADTYPTIRFQSTKVQLGEGGRISRGAQIIGDLTLRGITHPIALQADLFRQRGSAANSLDELSIRLKGALDRNVFGASGYSDLVADEVGLDIQAEIKRAG